MTCIREAGAHASPQVRVEHLHGVVKRRERLKEFDVTDAQLAKLHGPIGLYIGSKTPPEIAISILAEMTAIKNGVQIPAEMRVEMVLETLPWGCGRRASVTILTRSV